MALNVYWNVVIIAMIITGGAIYFIKRLISKDTSTDVSVLMITSGVTLIVSAFPRTIEIIGTIVASFLKVNFVAETDYASIACGFALVFLGLFYFKAIKERTYVLNMFGLFSQPEISDTLHIKQLNLTDYKVKEIIIDFVDVFQHGVMSEEKNQIIVKKIKKQCESFKNRATDSEACFTGMAPIPYTILAGNYLSGGNIKRFFEYIGKNHKYIELSHNVFFQKKYPELKVQYPDDIDIGATDIVVALSISVKVQDADLVQFNNDVLRIGLDKPANNIITRNDQLDNYCNLVVTEMERAREKYPCLIRIHLAASIPSCVSVRLGDQFRLRSNRLPKIISYHFVNNQYPKYPFGIVVADSKEEGYGRLIICNQRGT